MTSASLRARASKLTAALVGVLLSVSLLSVVAAEPASAEPHSYYMHCRNQYGQTYYITKPSQCSWGLIQIYSTYDRHSVGHIDMYKIQSRYTNSSLSALYRKCKANIICELAIVAAQAYVLGKIRWVYKWVRGLVH